jgi:hypothetical protein
MHLNINFQRIEESEDADLKDLLAECQREAAAQIDAGTGKQPGYEQLVWALFVGKADEAKIADRIPGSVGRRYRSKYGLVHHRLRGKRTRVAMTTAADAAVTKYRVDSDQFRVEDGMFVYTSRSGAVRGINQMLKRCTRDIVTPGREAAAHRAALKALLRRVDPDAA